MKKSLYWAAAMLCISLGLGLRAQAQYVIDSLDGEVTQHEVDSFISAATATSIPTAEWNATSTHNLLADGKGGMTLEGINYMAQITADIPSLSTEHTQLLNLAIAWNDAWLTHRNDMPLGEGRVMWTGKVEPVWPPNCPTCSSPTYYESEVGDTIEHMAFTAYNILKTPSIWNDTVPDGDPNNFGTTYLARAKTYVSMLEFSMSNSFTKYYIDPNTLLIMRPSTSLGYQSSFHNVNAWNVQMMLLGAYWRLSQCHVILGDNPSLASMYKTIVQKTTDMFVQNAQPLTAPDGTAVYDWGYCNFGDCTGRLTGEQLGVHASYDIWGLTRHYATGYTTVPTAQQMKTYADTLVHETTLSIDSAGAATYASFNDRCCSTATYSYLPYGFIFLTPYNTDIYRPAANADINSGRLAGDAGITAGILWAKHWIFMNSQPPDFTLSVGPASQTVTANGSTSYTATVSAINGFSGSVALSVSGLPNGATASFSPASVSGSGSSTLTVSTSCSTPAGTYSLAITGASGSLSHSATVTLIVSAAPSDFTISASPSSNTVIVGSGTSYTANISAANCFTGTVNLSVSGLPAGATGTFNPTSVATSGSSILSITTTSTTSTGAFTLTITGASGSLSHSAAVSLTVNPPPNFSISATPAAQSVIQGAGASYTASVSAINGFTGTVNLSASVSGAPAGVTTSFTPASITGSGSSALSVTTSSSTPVGTYTITITGTSGSLSHSATVSLTVNPPLPDFSLSATPSSQSITQSGSTSYTASVSALNGFAGTVSLSAAVSGSPAGVTTTFNPASITGSGSSTLSVTTLASTPSNTYTITITGSSGSLSHSATVTLVVNPATGLPSGWSDSDIGTPGVTGSASYNTSSGTFTVNGGGADIWSTSDNFNYARESLTGDLTITARVATQQNTNAWAKSGVMIRETAAANSAYVAVYVTPANGVDMQYRPSTGAAAVQLAQQTGHVAPYWVRLVRAGSTFTGFSSADGSTWTQVGTISVTLASNALEGLAVTAHNNTVLNTSTFDHVSLSTPAPDFMLSATPASHTVTVGGSTSYTASVTSVNGFTSTVNLSATVSGSPAGVTASLSPTSINGSGSSTLNVTTSSSTPTGTYTLTITGTSGGLSHSSTVSLTVNANCVTAPATGAWVDTPMGVTETGTFTAAFDATPSIAPISAAVGISQGAQTAFSGFANLVVFTTTGLIQARNGGGYQGTVAYSTAGQPYHFRLSINVPSHLYSVFVTEPGSTTEQTVGSNFAFRTEQNAVTSLDTWGALVNASPGGTLSVCNFTVQ